MRAILLSVIRDRNTNHALGAVFSIAAILVSACGKTQSSPTNDMAPSTCSPSVHWVAQPLDSSVKAYWGAWGSGRGDVYVVGDQAALHSRDGGQTWATTGAEAQTISDFQTVWGSPANDVYIGGGSIWHSTDAGATWAKLQWPVLTVWGLSAQDLFGQTATGLMHSADGGASWSASFSMQVLNVWGTSSSDLYLSSSFGSVFHSSDDGASWQMVLAGGTAMGGVAFGGTRGAVYAVGGSIMKSVDDGSHWTPLALPALSGSLNLRAIWTDASGNEIFAVGQLDDAGTASGIMLHSADAGVSWNIELQCPAAVLTAVWASTADDVYAVGELGFVLHRRQ